MSKLPILTSEERDQVRRLIAVVETARRSIQEAVGVPNLRVRADTMLELGIAEGYLKAVEAQLRADLVRAQEQTEDAIAKRRADVRLEEISMLGRPRHRRVR